MEAVRGSTSSCTSSEDEHGLGERTWDYVEVENPGELIETLRREHRGWKRLWNEELAKEAVGAVEGGIHGQWLQYLESQSGRWRRSWSWWTASIKKLSTAGRRLWQLHLVEMMLNQSPHTAQLRAVLQTYHGVFGGGQAGH